MKKLLSILCLAIFISGCSYLIQEAQKEESGKLSKKDIVIKYGIPYKELQTSGVDILQYRTWCGQGRDSGYCELREFTFDKDILVNDIIKFEYFDPQGRDVKGDVR